jgi:hypothetical protein
MNKFENVRITDFQMREVFGQHGQVRAQFQMNVRSEMLKNVATIFDGIADRSRVVNSDVARMMGSDFQYGAPVPAGEIPGGWEAERVAFILTAEITMIAGIVIETVVGGYTDKLPQKTEAGMNWDDVTFYVNSISEFRQTTVQTPEGIREIKHLHAVDHVLADLTPDYQGAPAYSPRAAKVRPCDTFNTIDLAYLLSTMDQDQMIDTRTLFTHMPTLSAREHVIPSVWLCTILRAYFQSSATAGIGQEDGSSLRSQARSYTLDRPSTQVPFLRVLSQVTGNPFSVSFQLNDIKQIDGNFRSRSTYLLNNDRPTGGVLSRKHLPDDMQENYQHGGEAIERASVLVGMAANALAAKMGLRKIGFHVDNRWAGVEQVVVHHVSSHGPHDNTEIIEQFRLRFATEVMPTVDMGGLWECRFRVRVDLYEETEVEWELTEQKTFHLCRIASFADALLSPMVMPATKGPQRAEAHVRLAADVDDIINSIDIPK